MKSVCLQTSELEHNKSPAEIKGSANDGIRFDLRNVRVDSPATSGAAGTKPPIWKGFSGDFQKDNFRLDVPKFHSSLALVSPISDTRLVAQHQVLVRTCRGRLRSRSTH